MAKKSMLRHIHIEPNDDGSAQIHAHRKPMPMKSADVKDTSPASPMMDYEGNDEKVGASSPEEAGAHVTRMLKEHFGNKGASNPYAKHPAKAAFGR